MLVSASSPSGSERRRSRATKLNVFVFGIRAMRDESRVLEVGDSLFNPLIRGENVMRQACHEIRVVSARMWQFCPVRNLPWLFFGSICGCPTEKEVFAFISRKFRRSSATRG